MEANTDYLGIALPKTEGNSVENIVEKTERNIWEITEGNIVERVVAPVVTAFWVL